MRNDVITKDEGITLRFSLGVADGNLIKTYEDLAKAITNVKQEEKNQMIYQYAGKYGDVDVAAKLLYLPLNPLQPISSPTNLVIELTTKIEFGLPELVKTVEKILPDFTKNVKI